MLQKWRKSMLNSIKVAKLREKMKALDLDGFLVTSKENRQYLTGFTGTFGWVLVTHRDVYLMTDFRYVEQAQQQAHGCKIVRFQHYEPVITLRMVMEELDVITLGVESDRMTVEEFELLAHHVRRKAITPLKGFIEELRRVKSEDEIALIAKAEAISDEAFSHVIKLIKPGMTELEIAMELEFQMRRAGASGVSFDTIVASGKRSSMPHGVATDKKVEIGDFITMDYGCVYQGYCSDITRTIALGQVDEKQETVYNLVRKAQEEALAAIKAGVTGKEVHMAAQNVFQDAGYGAFFGHGLGHSVGLEIHEEPRFSPKAEDVIQENMVITVEPGLYLPNWGGVRIEDLVVIKKDGYINLTHSPKELIIL
jgi:Xaa-Pro aminopeptidase